jgi:uncharacterized protein YjbJ (UPF0337 family)
MQGVAMNRDIVKGNWKQFTGVMKGQWGRLTDRPGDEIAAKRPRGSARHGVLSPVAVEAT